MNELVLKLIVDLAELRAQKASFFPRKIHVKHDGMEGLLIQQNWNKDSRYAAWARAHPETMLVWFIPAGNKKWNLFACRKDGSIEHVDPPERILVS